MRKENYIAKLLRYAIVGVWVIGVIAIITKNSAAMFIAPLILGIILILDGFNQRKSGCKHKLDILNKIDTLCWKVYVFSGIMLIALTIFGAIFSILTHQ